VTPALRAAIERYRADLTRIVNPGDAASISCNDLVRPYPAFQSEARAAFCTDIVATIAEIVAEILVDAGVALEPTPIRGA
jgi:hypothetical protein